MLARKKIWKKNFVFGHNFLQTEIKQLTPETTLYAETYLSKLKVDHAILVDLKSTMNISVELKSTMTIRVDLKSTMTIRADIKSTNTISVNIKSFHTQHRSTTVLLYAILVNYGLFIIRSLNWGYDHH